MSKVLQIALGFALLYSNTVYLEKNQNGSLQLQAGISAFSMAKSPPEKQPKIGGLAPQFDRYIVTHTCKNSAANRIVRSMSGQQYRLVQIMPFTPQFVIEATPSAISKLRTNDCVKSIQRDTPVAPSGLSKPGG